MRLLLTGMQQIPLLPFATYDYLSPSDSDDIAPEATEGDSEDLGVSRD